MTIKQKTICFINTLIAKITLDPRSILILLVKLRILTNQVNKSN